MNSAYGAPNSNPIGWRPSTTATNRFGPAVRRVEVATLVMPARYGVTSLLIFDDAPASASFGLCLPKMTDFDQASRNVCHISIEFGTLGTSTTCAASAAKVLYSGLALKYAAYCV